MRTEGRGIHPPARIQHKLSRCEALLCKDIALKISDYRQYQRHNSSWKRGLMEGEQVPRIGYLRQDVLPRFIGAVGEAAVISFLNRRAGTELSLDDRLRHAGDRDIDADACGFTLQIKARRADKSTAADQLNLVRAETEFGRLVLPSSVAAVFCEVNLLDLTAAMLGWMFCRDIKSRPRVPARQGNHLNVEIYDRELSTMNALADAIKVKKELY